MTTIPTQKLAPTCALCARVGAIAVGVPTCALCDHIGRQHQTPGWMLGECYPFSEQVKRTGNTPPHKEDDDGFTRQLRLRLLR